MSLDGHSYPITGTNHYPAETPWDRFWPEYDEAVITDDFDRIANLGMNTIRIFVPFAQFGGPKVEPEMLDRLEDYCHPFRLSH